MDATVVIGVLSAFLAVFLLSAGLSRTFRQEEQTGIDKDVESIEQKTISDSLIPTVLDVFEYEPLAYGEQESELADKLAPRLEPSLRTIARAYECQEVVRRFGRFLLWSSVAGIILELVFISLVACFGPGIVLFAAALSASFLVFGLCISFWFIRHRNMEQAEDLERRI